MLTNCFDQVSARVFFFSSRRRHTRWPRDWSSDVCSSDLADALGAGRAVTAVFRATDEPFLAGSAAFGRADFRVGFALTFEVVARPFAFERRTELRGAPLLRRRYRSI